MKKSIHKKRKLNNSGMTLVEIIVAIALLSIAIVPLMYAFVNVARFSGKARGLQQETVIAYTVMENCKALSAEEIEEQMTNGTFLAGMTVGSYKVDGTTDGKYYINDVVVDNQVYDIALTLEPRTAGRQTIMKHENMNPVLDAVFMAQSTKDTSGNTVAGLDEEAYWLAMDEIANNISADSISKGFDEVLMTDVEVSDSFKSGGLNEDKFKLNRKISIEVKSLGGGKEEATVKYQYYYDITGDVVKYDANLPSVTPDPMATPSPTPDPGATPTPAPEWDSTTLGTGGELLAAERNFKIYSNEQNITETDTANAKLENLYFFYYPGYKNNTDYPIEQDEIAFENNLGRALNVYLMKQQNLTMDPFDIQNAEPSYSPIMTGNLTGGDINLYHTLNINMVSGAATSWSGAVWNHTTNKGTPYFTETKQLMYDVKVNVYARDAFDGVKIDEAVKVPVLKLNGTKLNW